MKILVVCQHYWPEPFPLADICEELANHGHQVHVITDIPNYPMGEIYSEYKNKQRRTELHNGVQITRTYTIPRKHNVLFRFLNYYSYSISSTHCVKSIKDDYDIVFTVQSSPVMMTNAAFEYAKMHHKKVVIYVMDLWPASLKAGGISEKSLIYSYYHKVSGKLYRKADKILVTSKMFTNYLESEHKVNYKNIIYLPQYAEDNFVYSENANKVSSIYNFVFAGNIGIVQDIPTIIKAAKILKNYSNIHWHIIGDGSDLEHCKSLAKGFGLQHITFYGRLPVEDMPKYYSMASAMLITLTNDSLISLTLPHKLQTYMAAGKPILGAADGAIPELIKDANCGFCVKSGDYDALANAVLNFIGNSNKSELANNSRNYYDTHFRKQVFMEKLEKILTI